MWHHFPVKSHRLQLINYSTHIQIPNLIDNINLKPNMDNFRWDAILSTLESLLSRDKWNLTDQFSYEQCLKDILSYWRLPFAIWGNVLKGCFERSILYFERPNQVWRALKTSNWNTAWTCCKPTTLIKEVSRTNPNPCAHATWPTQKLVAWHVDTWQGGLHLNQQKWLDILITYAWCFLLVKVQSWAFRLGASCSL